ncbi:MAG TPA: FG-GAP-like repeat-containing protein, partial [Planctomycetaceae bacterium]
NRLVTPAPPPLFDAPQFQLTDETGAAFGSDELRGRVWIANFMFTKCAATCPQQTARLAELQRRARNWPDWDRLRLVSISVDPQHDTPARLRDYSELHSADSSHWKFLTGPRAELFRISKEGFKLPVSENAAGSTSPLMHSSKLILVDGRLRIRGYYDSLADGDFLKLRNELRAVLSEPDAEPSGIVHIGVPPSVFDESWMEARGAAQLATADEIDVYHDFAFSDRIDDSGIQFISRAVADAGKTFKANHYDHGNGIAVADVDQDGLYDVYFVNQVGGCELWRNLGQGRFEDFTAQAGVALLGRVGVSASFADTDNDGDPDLFVTTTRHGNAFFENDGAGHFRDATADSGLAYVGHSSSGEFFDYDRDGRLDLFLTNVGVFTSNEIYYNGDSEKQEYPNFVGLKDAMVGHLFPVRSERSILYHNEGDNRFRDVSEEMGLVDTGWSGDATPIDANGDGWIDLYVLNMQGNDDYYENVEGKRFEKKSRELFPVPPWGALGLKSFDYNNDGLMDLFVTNMHADMWNIWPSGPQEKRKTLATAIPRGLVQGGSAEQMVLGNAFYENAGDGKFREVSDRINAENYWPWGLSVGDLNADGFQDAFITSSMNYDFRYQVNSLFLNDRGRKFIDAEFILGVEPRRDGKTATPWFELDCAEADSKHPLCAGRGGRIMVWAALGSRSSVIFDLDQDGDLDIVTNDFNSRPMVLVSNLAERNSNLRYLKILLRGARSNRDGLGARVEVTAGGQTLTQVHDGQSGYL